MVLHYCDERLQRIVGNPVKVGADISVEALLGAMAQVGKNQLHHLT
ncbi:hypothetical protein ACFQ5Q_14160 [Luteolibacter ambystomatis]